VPRARAPLPPRWGAAPLARNAVRFRVGKSSTPDGSFALPMTMNEVLAQVQSFIVTT
jgi:hypothetical protein